jgi:hypothetical protein
MERLIFYESISSSLFDASASPPRHVVYVAFNMPNSDRLAGHKQ